MSPELEPIVEKIKKLVELQKGAEAIGSLKEAANAAEKIQKILIRHNLDMERVNHLDNGRKKPADIQKGVYRDVYAKKNEGQWIYSLYSCLSSHNFCMVVSSSFYDPSTRKRNKYVNIVGTPENIQVVKFLADTLEERLRVLEKRAWSEAPSFEKRNSFRRSYFHGAVVGINAQLVEAKERAMRDSAEVTALVVSHKDRINRALPELFGNLKSGRASASLRKYSSGAEKGYEDGKSISINKGISGNERKYLN